MNAKNRSVVQTDQAPAAIGPYSQAIQAAGLIFVSGQLALDPASGVLVQADIQAETAQAITNLKTILTAAGSSLEQVVKTTLFIRNMDDFPKINETYARFFPSSAPARSCVEVSRLPRNAHVEIEAVALLIS